MVQERSQRVARTCAWDWRKTNPHERLKAVFMGVDDNFGMLLRDEDGTTSNIPLTTLLEE